MTTDTALLHGFAYGEHLEGSQRRSLGYRLLTPSEPMLWNNEVEELARRLQSAPYPDHWPPTELFCSVLLADGQRIVAAARYGLADHTSQPRRGGLELFGVVGPGSLGVASARALYQWLRQRRATTNEINSLGGQHPLRDVLASISPVPPNNEPVPILPIRIWQGGALLFAATTPTDPDHRLGLLEQGAVEHWQWLPLVAADFPLQIYTQRGPLIAWTPHLTGVAVKLDPTTEIAAGSKTAGGLLSRVAVVLLLALLIVNAWITFGMYRQLNASNAMSSIRETITPTVVGSSEVSAERFAKALARLIQRQGTAPATSPNQLASQFDRLAANDPDLRLGATEGKEVVVMVQRLARRGPENIDSIIRKTLANKGYDPQLIDLICQRVREQLAIESVP